MSENDYLPTDQQEDLDDLSIDSQSYGAVVHAADWTVQTILQQIRKGNIELNPDFQRREAWRLHRKSNYIESLILGIPVPQIVLAERKDQRGQFIVIDGKQRLLTLRQFTSDREDSAYQPFKLAGLAVRKDLNGLTYEDLTTRPDYQADLNALDNSTIRTAVIRNWKDEEFLYAVFLRLNTGSVPLSPQELRQALHPGPFVRYVDKYSRESEIVRKLLHLNAPDVRMRDAELIIRYFAFRNFLGAYRGSLKQLLDKTAEHFNNNWERDQELIEAQTHELEQGVSACFAIFGQDNACRKWNGKEYEPALNRAIFDALMHYFINDKIAARAVKKRAAVEAAFKKICADNHKFRAAVEGTTKSIESIYTRLRLWGEVLKEVLRIEFPLPELKNNRIHV